MKIRVSFDGAVIKSSEMRTDHNADVQIRPVFLPSRTFAGTDERGYKNRIVGVGLDEID